MRKYGTRGTVLALAIAITAGSSMPAYEMCIRDRYRNINVHDDSWGYYITNGKAMNITWKKDGEFGVTHYYGPDDQEIVINRGKTWVCIVPTSDAEKIKFE